MASSKPVRAAASRRSSSDDDNTAADMLFNLLESQLVADLLAVGATAALAAIAETPYSRRTGSDGGSKRALKAAAMAAAGAIGRRLANEFEEIRKAADKSKSASRA